MASGPAASLVQPIATSPLGHSPSTNTLAECRDQVEQIGENAAPSMDEESDWPSGWRPYACLLGGFMLMFNSWGIVNAYGTFASYYMQHLLPHHDILLFNLIGSTQSFIVLVLSAPVGRLLDAGYSRLLIVTGTVLVSLGTFLLSVVNGNAGYNQGNYALIWLTQGLVTGLGMACFFVSSSQVVATWFHKRKSFAIGVVASGASIAGLVYPLMTKYLIASSSHNFNNAVRYVAAVVTTTATLAIFIARPNPNHPLRKPEKWMKAKVFIDVGAARNVPFLWLCAAISFLFFGFYAVFFNLEEWAAAKGFGYKDQSPIDIQLPKEVRNDAIRTFWLLSIMNACSTTGRIGSAYLSDRFGALNVHAVVTFVASLLILLLWTMASNVSAAIAFVVIFGAFSGAVIGLPPASVAYILGPNGQAKLGHYTGMMYTCSSVFALTGPVIAGHLISSYGQNYLTVQIWSGISLFLSACCMSIAVYCQRRRVNVEGKSDQRIHQRDSESEQGLSFRTKPSSRATSQTHSCTHSRTVSEIHLEKDAALAP